METKDCGQEWFVFPPFCVALWESVDCLRHGRDFLGVRDHHDGLALLFVEFPEYFHHPGCGCLVQVAGGFVRQDDWRIVDECACDGDALLFSA